MLKNIVIDLGNQKVQALHFHDKENNRHTLSTIEKGGALISGKTLEEAKINFTNALKLALAVRNFLHLKYSRYN